MNEAEFLKFLQDTLFIEEDLEMDNAMPEASFDSTGIILLMTATEQTLNKKVTGEMLKNCHTPKDIYTALGFNNAN